MRSHTGISFTSVQKVQSVSIVMDLTVLSMTDTQCLQYVKPAQYLCSVVEINSAPAAFRGCRHIKSPFYNNNNYFIYKALFKGLQRQQIKMHIK